MTNREEVLKYGLSFADVYVDTPFHDENWVLLRYRKNKKAFAWTYERNGHILGKRESRPGMEGLLEKNLFVSFARVSSE